jgi:hypothetical protein
MANSHTTNTPGQGTRLFLPVVHIGGLLSASRLALAMAILATLTGCASTQLPGDTSLEQLTRRYRDTKADERVKLLGPIADAFVALARSGSTDHIAADIPTRTLKELTAARDKGFGVEPPRWSGLYACNGFLYIHEFTCRVKSPVSSGGPDRPTTIRDEWFWAKPRSYLLYEGEYVVHFP